MDNVNVDFDEIIYRQIENEDWVAAAEAIEVVRKYVYDSSLVSLTSRMDAFNGLQLATRPDFVAFLERINNRVAGRKHRFDFGENSIIESRALSSGR